jgi:hypothetical protein
MTEVRCKSTTRFNNVADGVLFELLQNTRPHGVIGTIGYKWTVECRRVFVTVAGGHNSLYYCDNWDDVRIRVIKKATLEIEE